jgi:hypothetical protein
MGSVRGKRSDARGNMERGAWQSGHGRRFLVTSRSERRRVGDGHLGRAKEGKVWKGTWQARRASGQVYDGTWRAQVELPTTSHFSDLFEAAIAKAVSGSWRTGGYSGAWTIRAQK